MLSLKQIELVKRLLTLTNSNKIYWDRYKGPNSFIYSSSNTDFIVNTYTTEINIKKYKCYAFTILMNGIVYEDLVLCLNIDDTIDFMLIRELHQAVINSYNNRHDIEISNILESLPV